MSTTRTVLHLGAHKTGTSLIQKYVRDNPQLAADLGIAYISRADANGLIGSGRRLEDQPQRLRGRLAEELGRRPAAVLASHENTLGRPVVADRPGLYPHAHRFATALAGICAAAGAEPHIVYYVRPLADFLESYYLQTVHQGSHRSFERWVGRLDLPSLSWGPVIAALDEVFGEDRVVLGDFREIGEGQPEFLRRFLVRAGLPQPTEIAYTPVRNPSVSDRGLRMALAINPLLEAPSERKEARKFLQRHFNNRSGERARPMPDHLREQLRRADEPEYQRLAARAEASLVAPPPQGRP